MYCSNEALQFSRGLYAGRAFHAAGYVHGKGMASTDGGGDVIGVQAAGKEARCAMGGQFAPVEGRTAATALALAVSVIKEAAAVRVGSEPVRDRLRIAKIAHRHSFVPATAKLAAVGGAFKTVKL